MKKYFFLQLKLSGRLLPFVLGATLALLLGVGLILSGLLASFRTEEGSKELTVAISGDTDNTYLQWGISALQMGEDSPFSVFVVEMSQDKAHTALKKGEISAYVIIPEGLMEKALAGESFEPITYVTSAGIEGFSGFLKREITTWVTKIVVYSQKGSYGLAELLTDHDLDKDVNTHMTVLALEYADLIIHRDSIYQTETLGVSDGLSTGDYYICAATVILLSLMGLPYAATYIRQDYALPRMLHSRGFSTARQLLCEYGAHLLCMLILGGFLLTVTAIALKILPALDVVNIPALGDLVLRIVPVLFMLAALNMLLFTLSGNMVSGLLLHFFGTIGLCYVSGCIYPITAFPMPVQHLAAVLPTGIARHHLSTAFSHGPAWGSFGGLILYTLVFLGIALPVRIRKTAGIER